MAGAGAHGSSFWEFSLGFYDRPGVAEACLQLQDQAGVDVNVLLYALFLATGLREIDRTDAARIDACAKTWREQVVIPLRTLRRQLKIGIEPYEPADTARLRSTVKRVELDAERIEQEYLERLFPPGTSGTLSASRDAAAQANVAAYGELCGGLPAVPVAALLAALADAGT
jgi:uncharacterized protein (TIGR02444 family)